MNQKYISKNVHDPTCPLFNNYGLVTIFIIFVTIYFFILQYLSYQSQCDNKENEFKRSIVCFNICSKHILLPRTPTNNSEKALLSQTDQDLWPFENNKLPKVDKLKKNSSRNPFLPRNWSRLNKVLIYRRCFQTEDIVRRSSTPFYKKYISHVIYHGGF